MDSRAQHTAPPQPDKPVYVRPHATARFREHYPDAGWRSVVAAMAEGTPVEPSLIRALLQREPTPHTAYIAPPERRGVIVLSCKPGVRPKIITYLRFGDAQASFLRDPMRGAPPEPPAPRPTSGPKHFTDTIAAFRAEAKRRGVPVRFFGEQGAVTVLTAGRDRVELPAKGLPTSVLGCMARLAQMMGELWETAPPRLEK